MTTKNKVYSMRMHGDDFDKLSYWSEKFNVSKSDLLIDALDYYIRYKNGDYDLPRAEIIRLNQLIEAVNSLVSTNENLEKSVVSGFDAMLGIVRGGSYLLDDEDGEL